MKKINTNILTLDIVLLCMVFLLCFSSCEKELKLPIIEKPSKVLLIGELIAGDTVLVRAGQSAPFSPDTTVFNIIQDLQLTIAAPSGTTYPMLPYEDFNSEMLKTLPFSNTMQLQAGNTYIIRSQHPTLDSVLCPVSIPKPFTSSIKDTSSKVYASVPVMEFGIELQDDPAAENYYMVEVMKQAMSIDGRFLHDGFWRDIAFERELYDSLKKLGPVQTEFDTIIQYQYPTRIGLYTTDDLTENVKFGTVFSTYGRVLLSDRAINGSVYTLRLFAEKQYFKSDFFKGRVVVKVKSIAKEYFNYLKVYERSNVSDVSVGAGVPLKLEGNVKNGLGVVGGVYLREYYYYFDDWGF